MEWWQYAICIGIGWTIGLWLLAPFIIATELKKIRKILEEAD